MKIGISTACFYPLEPEKAAEFLALNNLPYTEFFVNSFYELKPPFLKEFKSVLGDTQVLSLHPFTSGFEPMLFFSNYRRRVQDGLDFYKHYFEACQFLGAKILVLHGDKRESGCSNETYFERYHELFNLGKSYGVTVAQENVARCKGGSIEFLCDMKKALPETRFVLDLKQARRAGEDSLKILDVLGDSICHIHISDGTLSEECLPIGEGTTNFKQFFEALDGIGYSEGIILELYRKNYNDYNDLIKSYDKILNFV